MTDNDIYNSKAKYEQFLADLERLATPPEEDNYRRKYWVKNKANLKYFKQLARKFDARDISYIRRLRLFRTFLIACHVLDQDLSSVEERGDIDKVVAFSHTVNKSPKSKADFAIDLKFLWKQLFPETDERGRADDSIVPYVVRHISGKVDKSKEKMRGDKYSFEEFTALVQGFGDDARMQALLTIMQESLSRPQELLGRRIRDVELHDNYAKIYISEHGKEGTGFLRVIDSYYYLTRWLNHHPQRSNPEAWLFVNTGRINRFQQMKPPAANKLIRDRCKKLGIRKPITMYSLKRNGVTLMRLRGASDLDIQHTARWTSTKQLHTYDLSSQEEAFEVELVKRGVVKGKDKFKGFRPTTKVCIFCGQKNGLAEVMCSVCKRPLDREKVLEQIEQKETSLADLKQQMAALMAKFTELSEMNAERDRRNTATQTTGNGAL